MISSFRGVVARRRLRLAALVLPAVLLVPIAGCNSADVPDGTAAAPVPSAAADAGARVGGPPAVENAVDLTQKPVAAAGEGVAPADLVTRDLVTGEGAAASATSTVKIQYVGTIWKTGKEFDSSWSRGAADTFSLLRTVPGFGQGIDGMKAGGRRLIVIPPALGYGPMGGQAPVIAADDSLVFVVDLLEVVPDGAEEGTSQGTADPGSGSL
ncbi:FKBP-type peptidyl-prolyl cis-trans isomerase [Parafrankia discariae]|uniref:FKBP-type peptidyl-prolyl cis-trans isomerase n=1 Tax=Parafrankia discariae TaxID=365528 RepID=UPI00039B26E8|nr:FKBP-type peptidyl-prolyl cis-trans isomerase [Parafrankia discariae]